MISKPSAASPPQKILVIDDDAEALALIGARLEARGFAVVRAGTGQEALVRLDEQYFPLMLTDWQMPTMDGIQLSECVRGRGIDDTYIVMLTARDERVDYERGSRAGIDDYLTKDTPEAEWFARIKAALATAALRRELKDARTALRRHVSVPDPAPVTATSQTPAQDFDDTTQILALPVMHMPKVLLVDDDEILLERLRIPIAEAGYEVTTVTDGAAALAALAGEFMSIVILDRSMPGMDGLEVCRVIRNQPWPSYVYLILLTAHDSEVDVLRGLNAGADDYLGKRVSDAQLVARLGAATRVLSLEHSLKAALEERRRMAMSDALTGAHNRRYFMRHLRGEIKRARRFGTELSLLVLDIDHFKTVNDQHGHAAGDLVLQAFVRQVQSCLPREYDWCARLGGEEFAVVLPQTNLDGAAVVAEKLRNAISKSPVKLSTTSRSITVSIGVSGLEAMPDRAEITVETLLAHADRFLYQSKDAGRNRVTLPKPGKVSR